jgi:hypothetical protein
VARCPLLTFVESEVAVAKAVCFSSALLKLAVYTWVFSNYSEPGSFCFVKIDNVVKIATLSCTQELETIIVIIYPLT